MGFVVPVPDWGPEAGYVGVLLGGCRTGAVADAGDRLADGVRVVGAVKGADLRTELDDAGCCAIAVVTENRIDRCAGSRGEVQVFAGSGRERFHHDAAVGVFRVA